MLIAANSDVPTPWNSSCLYGICAAVRASRNFFASPKSITFTICAALPVPMTKFAGLTSRCTIEFEWMNSMRDIYSAHIREINQHITSLARDDGRKVRAPRSRPCHYVARETTRTSWSASSSTVFSEKWRLHLLNKSSSDGPRRSMIMTL